MTELTALQAALAAEQATVYGYGIVGPLVDATDRDYALAALQTHMLARDQLMTMITALGATPVAARPAYRLPFPVDSATTARDLGAHLEQGSCGAFWDVIAASDTGSSLRSHAIGWLGDAALRAAHWGAQQALPGQPA